jgi:soluble epoxide hydrolase / lipid-phosphate phosphatase
MASITAPSHAKTLTVSDGTKYGYICIQAQAGKPTLLFLHGYPSSSYHWHNQVQQCIDAGYGTIAPDLLGYGDTSKPTEVSAYDNTVMAKHVIEILDHEKLPIVVGIGHDVGDSWGT